MKTMILAGLFLGGAALADPCDDAAKHLSGFIALDVVGFDAPSGAMEAVAPEAEKRWAKKCKAAPEKSSPAVKCWAETKSVETHCGDKPGADALKRWNREVSAELKKK